MFHFNLSVGPVRELRRATRVELCQLITAVMFICGLQKPAAGGKTTYVESRPVHGRWLIATVDAWKKQ